MNIRNMLKRIGQICLPLGAAIFVLLKIVTPWSSAAAIAVLEWVGGIPLMIGLAYVIIYFAQGKNPYGKEKKPQEPDNSQEPPKEDGQ